MPPSFMRKPYPEVEESLQQASTFFIAPRCFCMLSEFPFFKPHLSVLKGIVSKSHAIATRTLLLSQSETQGGETLAGG